MISNYGKMFVGYFGYMYVLPLLNRHQILYSYTLIILKSFCHLASQKDPG